MKLQINYALLKTRLRFEFYFIYVDYYNIFGYLTFSAAVEDEGPGRVDQKGQLHYIYMKKYIDSVNEDLHEKTVAASKTRSELEKCQERVADLENERDRLFYLIDQADQNEDV